MFPHPPPACSAHCSGPPVLRFTLTLLHALSAARGAGRGREPEHLAHLHPQPQGDADEPGKNGTGLAGAFGDQEMPPWHRTSPVLSSLQALPIAAWPKRRSHCMERSSQISPKLLKQECNNTPVSINPGSDQWDSRRGPSTSPLSQNCGSLPATSSHRVDAGGDQGHGPPHYPISSPSLWASRIFPSLCAPQCTQSLG